jgi:hypothetical protein
MKCNCCDEKVTECDECHNRFEKGDTIFCEGVYHFCSEGCILDYEGIDEGEVE